MLRIILDRDSGAIILYYDFIKGAETVSLDRHGDVGGICVESIPDNFGDCS